MGRLLIYHSKKGIIQSIKVIGKRIKKAKKEAKRKVNEVATSYKSRKYSNIWLPA